jgi:hypothetical protein
VGENPHITPGKKGREQIHKKVSAKVGKKILSRFCMIQRKPGGLHTLKGTSKTSWPGKERMLK